MSAPLSPEQQRLAEDEARILNWKRWGPYLSERQWATVREDYSANGECWDYFPHDHSRSRAYRWGEDGLLGFTDRECRLCFALALWNERDPILKERLFGLTGPEGNHGEDVKECYYYLDSTPTHSYAKALYKYPQAEFPYDRLVKENRARGINGPEFELIDTGIFNEGRYFDVQAEYAKAGPDDLCIRLTLSNRGPAPATLHVLPTLWFRNIWSWGRLDGRPKPELYLEKPGLIRARHHSLGEMLLAWEDAKVEALFTENETDSERLWKTANACPYVKDAFHKAVVNRQADAVNPEKHGTKAAPHFTLALAPGEERVLRLRLVAASAAPKDFFGPSFEETFRARLAEADEFYAALPCPHISIEAQAAARQAYAGLLWSKQFYHYVVADWLEGDPGQPAPPPQRFRGRNSDWPHFYSYDILSMPDKWEYPWFAAWDLAFHMIPMATVDPAFAKNQLKLLLREWYMHPNGQIPAYEFAFGDVNPPVHAWAAWRVYKMTGERGQRDRAFLEGVFQKLLLNFTWWVNRKDAEGQNLFQGGFLGLDNIGVFDRSKPLPTGGYLQQADGTAWMGFYCLTMLSMALELAQDNPVYEDLASKFFEHFVHITDAINRLGGSGLWDETDGFYYDQLKIDGQSIPLRTRSLVGLLPLIAVEVLEEEMIQKLPGFRKRLEWFVAHRPDIAELSAMCDLNTQRCYRLLAIPSEVRLRRTLQYLLDEKEFLSPYGIRSLSRVYEKQPFVFRYNGQEYSVDYEPCESRTYLFGGNSNWRGPVWFPINYLIIEALERYHHFYGGALEVEFPTGSGQKMTLDQVANALSKRMASLFLPDDEGHRPCHGGDERYAIDPYWRNLLLFYEYFHSETGRGCGASHQTGWTALVTRNLVACQECEKLPKAGA